MGKAIYKKVSFLFQINIWKTIYLNMRYFCFKDALKLPILVYPHTTIEKASGHIKLKCPLKKGIISIGKHGLGNRFNTIWLVSGELIVYGNVYLGSGTKISIGKNASLSLGKNFSVTGDTSIICKKKITIGNDCIFSWDDLIMDSDFHHIYDRNGIKINQPSSIEIGDNVWIACRATILKGSIIPSGCVIACSTLTTSLYNVPNTVIGGGQIKIDILRIILDGKNNQSG